MEARELELIVSLLDRDPDLKKFYKEHQECEQHLQDYQHKMHLTAAEEVEKKRIQKLKLAKKDKIMEILGRYRHEAMPREKQ